MKSRGKASSSSIPVRVRKLISLAVSQGAKRWHTLHGAQLILWKNRMCWEFCSPIHFLFCSNICLDPQRSRQIFTFPKYLQIQCIKFCVCYYNASKFEMLSIYHHSHILKKWHHSLNIDTHLPNALWRKMGLCKRCDKLRGPHGRPHKFSD